MNALMGDTSRVSRGGSFKGLAWLGGVLATVVAAAIGAVLAVFLTATMVVITLMGAALLFTGGMAMRARRMVRAKGRRREPDVIEARNIGGHSWVAYGWDRHGR